MSASSSWATKLVGSAEEAPVKIDYRVRVRIGGNLVSWGKSHLDLAAADLQIIVERYTWSESPVFPQVAKQQPQFAEVRWELGQRVTLGLLQAASILPCISSCAFELDCRRLCSELDVDLDLSRIAISVW